MSDEQDTSLLEPSVDAIIQRAKDGMGGWRHEPEFNQAHNLTGLFDLLFTQVKSDANRIAGLQRKLGQYAERLP